MHLQTPNKTTLIRSVWFIYIYGSLIVKHLIWSTNLFVITLGEFYFPYFFCFGFFIPHFHFPFSHHISWWWWWWWRWWCIVWTRIFLFFTWLAKFFAKWQQYSTIDFNDNNRFFHLDQCILSFFPLINRRMLNLFNRWVCSFYFIFLQFLCVCERISRAKPKWWNQPTDRTQSPISWTNILCDDNVRSQPKKNVITVLLRYNILIKPGCQTSADLWPLAQTIERYNWIVNQLENVLPVKCDA